VRPKAVAVLPSEARSVALAIAGADTRSHAAYDGGAPMHSYLVEWWTVWGTKTEVTVLQSSATAGSFSLGRELPLDMAAYELEAALEALPGVGQVTIAKSALGGVTKWRVTLDGEASAVLQVASSSLAGVGAAVEVCSGAAPTGNCLAGDSVVSTAPSGYCNSLPCPLVSGDALDVADGALFSHTIEGLVPGQAYQVAVTPKNSNQHNGL
jgi:hypothetical protein